MCLDNETKQLLHTWLACFSSNDSQDCGDQLLLNVIHPQECTHAISNIHIATYIVYPSYKAVTRWHTMPLHIERRSVAPASVERLCLDIPCESKRSSVGAERLHLGISRGAVKPLACVAK